MSYLPDKTGMNLSHSHFLFLSEHFFYNYDGDNFICVVRHTRAPFRFGVANMKEKVRTEWVREIAHY